MKQFLLLTALLLSVNAFATHNHAGEILIEQIGALTIRASVITYTPDKANPADRPSLTVHWGDGTSQVVNRTGNGTKFVDSELKVNVYETTHTFTTLGKYTIYMTDPNRNGGILNVNFPNSDLVAFHIQATITLMPVEANGKYNKTPELRRYPIDVATIGFPFRHFPDAVDADGDSLAFRLITPMQSLHTSLPNYQLPNLIVPNDSNRISFNQVNGTFDWKNPQLAGLYSIAIQIISYRRGVAIDTTVRDMNIIVQGRLTSLESVDNQGFVQLSPNPIYTEGVLHIAENFGQNVQLSIVNVHGQIMETADLRQQKYYTIKRKNWVNGVYFIDLKSENKRTVVKMTIMNE
jgi:hypothetical protein